MLAPPLSRRAVRIATLLVAALGVAVLPTASAAPAPTLVAVGAWKPIPSYAAAARDEPVTYQNGCHAPGSVTKPKPCTFGVKSGSRTVLLLGDSHAAHWHAAVLGSARSHGWRMRTLTKSGCPAADVPVRRYRSTSAYPECQKWRSRALAGLASSRWGTVDVVVLSNWHFHAVTSSVRGSRLSASAKAGPMARDTQAAR